MSISPLAIDPAVALLLAAGYSQRFGSDKTLYPLSDGTAMALATARRIQSLLPWLCVVVRPEQRTLQALLTANNIAYIEAHDAHLGIGASLRCGILATAAANGWLIALADMPYIKPQTYLTVYQLLINGNTQRLCAPYFQGKRGHPVGFSKDWKQALLRCPPIQGARTILQQHEALIARVAVDDAGIIFDIDEKIKIE